MKYSDRFRIGRLMFTRLPKGSPIYRKGDGFRLGPWVGIVIMQFKQWVIWRKNI